MRVLMLSRDPNTERPGTAAYARCEDYRRLVDELRVVCIDLSMSLVRAWNISREMRPDLVTVQDPFEAGLVAVVIARMSHARLEVQVHTDLFSPEYAKESWWNRFHVWCAKCVLPRADSVRVVSARVRDGVIAHTSVSPQKVVVLPIAVDVEKVNLAIPTKLFTDTYPMFRQVVLVASRLTREKEIDTIVRAFARSVAEEPTLGLVIVGDGPEKEHLVLLAHALGVSDRVAFEAWRNDIPSLMKSVTLYVATSRYEGYGLTLVEAAVAHCPIVTTDVGIVGDVLSRDMVSVVPHRDVVAVAKAIIKIVRDREYREKMVERAYSVTQKLPTYEAYLDAVRRAWRV